MHVSSAPQDSELVVHASGKKMPPELNKIASERRQAYKKTLPQQPTTWKERFSLMCDEDFYNMKSIDLDMGKQERHMSEQNLKRQSRVKFLHLDGSQTPRFNDIMSGASQSICKSAEQISTDRETTSQKKSISMKARIDLLPNAGERWKVRRFRFHGRLTHTDQSKQLILPVTQTAC